MRKFEIKETFYLDDEEFKLISGAIHYFRVVPEYWKDRLEKLKLMGCNTVETIVPWNIHEPEQGKYNFEGINNLENFIEIAHELGLYVIVRPSPYICGEWEFGGTPYWLLNKQDIRMRSSEGKYLNYVESYYKELIPKIAKHQITNNGNVIMVQIENEYGYFSDDKNYMLSLKTLLEKYGINVPLFTSDGPWGDAIDCGNMMEHGVLETLNFGSKTDIHFDAFEEKFPNAPLVCMEYWIGWFDAFGEKHHLRSPKDCAVDLDKILKRGHVNIYVFEGGTNFGYMNGANDYDKYMPLVTSYDYDALLTENGQFTEKYEEFKKVISKYVDIPEFELSTKIKTMAYNTIKVDKVFDAFKNIEEISTKSYYDYPQTFEQLNHPYGYVYYKTNLGNKRDIESSLYKAADRAIYYSSDSLKRGTLYDREIESKVKFTMEHENETLGVLVENVGRVNFHPKLDYQSKGIQHSLIINDHIKTGFEHYALTFENLSQLSEEYTTGEAPTISRFILNIDEKCDTYVDVSKFGKGILILNDEVLGRFWDIGSQERLYIPAPLLNLGENDIYIFETEGKVADELSFYTEQKWSAVEVHEATEN